MFPAGEALAQHLRGIGMNRDAPCSASFCNLQQGLNRAHFTLAPDQ